MHRTRRLLAGAAILAPLLVPVAAASPARANLCPPGSVIVTAAPLYLQVVGPAVVTPFVAFDPFGATCDEGTLGTHCPVVTNNTGTPYGIVAMAPQSCASGATQFLVV